MSARARLTALVAVIALAPALGAQRPGQVARPAPAVRTPPPAPTNLRVVQTQEGHVLVSWDEVPGAKSYFVGRAVGLGGFQRLPDGTVGTPSYLDRAVQQGVKHVYLVSAIDSSGLAGARTRSDSIVPTAAAPRATTPEPPANFRVERVAGDTVALRWNTGMLTRYQLRASRDDGAHTVLADNIQGSSYVARGLASGRWQFELATRGPQGQLSPPARTTPVQVVAPGGTGAGGTTAGGTTTGASSSARLAAPTDLRVQQEASGAIQFSWGHVRGAKHYVVERSIGLVDPRGSTGKNVWSTTTTETRVTEKYVKPGERYVYTVAAVDSADRRGMRATATEFTPRDTMEFDRPPAPSDVLARAGSDDAVTLRWRAETTAKPDAKPTGSGRAYFEVAHIENDGLPRVLGNPERPEASVPGLRPGRHQFVVTTVVNGKRSDPARSNVVVLPRETSGATDGAAGTPPDAQVVVTKGDPVVLRVGATHSLAALGQSGWTSLATGVATVSSTAVVTARAAGDVQLVRVAPDAGNVVRVTVVSVRVTP